MNSLSFTRSTLVAFLISASIASVYSLISMFFTSALSDSLMVRACFFSATFLYLLYLLKHSKASFGKLSALSLLILANILMLYLWPTLLTYSVINIAFIWLVRTVYFHSSTVLMLFDFCACVLSFVLTIVVAFHSHSMFLCLWTFLLAQAFIMPAAHSIQDRWFKKSKQTSVASSDVSQRFYQAHRLAEDALRKMA